MITAVVWHYWLGLILLLAALVAVAQVAVGYFAKVSSTRYPNRRQRQAQRTRK